MSSRLVYLMVQEFLMQQGSGVVAVLQRIYNVNGLTAAELLRSLDGDQRARAG